MRVEQGLPPIVPDAISFETGASKAQTQDPTLYVYEHHGAEFPGEELGALPRFYQDLILGRAFPLTLATPGINDIDTLVAITLFLHRDLATHPATTSFVYTVDFAHRLGFAALAHIEEDLARFFTVLRGYLPDNLGQREFAGRLTTAMGWIREYIHNATLPTLGPKPESNLRIIDAGTNGFVLAEASGSLYDAWYEIFKAGWLRGILIEVGSEDRRRVLMAKKSQYLTFDLNIASRLLNQMETVMGELPEWKVSSDGLWLEGPPNGTLILMQHLTDVMLRV